jgi:hypothetical protein
MYTTDYIRYYKIGRPDGIESYVKNKSIYFFPLWRGIEGEDFVINKKTDMYFKTYRS